MTPLTKPGWRAAGVVLAGVCIYLFDPSSQTLWQQLGIPLLLVVAAYLMTQAAMAVAFASLALAFVNMDLGAAHWVPAIAYPGIALVSLIVCLGISVVRFKQRIADTHEQRWRYRARSAEESVSAPPQEHDSDTDSANR